MTRTIPIAVATALPSLPRHFSGVLLSPSVVGMTATWAP
jgi:hypothetical protein